MVETRIDRNVLKDLMQRSNIQGILFYGGWFALLVSTGIRFREAAKMPGVHGASWRFSSMRFSGMNNSHLHESLHGTPYKTRVLNRIMFFITTAMEFRATRRRAGGICTITPGRSSKDVDLEIHAPAGQTSGRC